MANALFSSTIEVALEMTLSLANERIGKLFQLEEDLETLRESVAMIQAVLADAEKKQTYNQAVQLWLRRLEGVAFDAENLLDELNYEVLRCQFVDKVRSFILSSDINIVFRWRMACKIRDINKKLNKINKEASDFRLVRNQGKTFPPSTTAKVTLNGETDSVVGHNVVGRAKDETSLVETLLSLSEKEVSVIPFLGMGGLGKTTLAQSVYNNRQADSHFEKKIWGLNATNGNWCIVTTRKQQIASIVATHDSYVLGKLSEDDCWSILTEKAIADGGIPEQLHVMKKEIIKKCCGLPLAASVMGGLLRMKGKEEWQLILKNKLSILSGDEDGVMEILNLSFDCLPSPSIKKCFAYCSIFPKDTGVERNMLIELWMAEGFLQADVNSQMMMEEIGMNYLRILLQSSLFEETSHVRGTYYKMHDLVHDLAESVSKSTKVINSETQLVDNSIQVRYLAIDSFGEHTMKLLESLSTSLHTLFIRNSLFGDRMLRKWYVNLFGGGMLKKLKNFLPKSVCKLYNLQTLRLSECIDLKEFPKGMCNLINLRHLHYYNPNEKFQMPLNMGRLTCLQTLEFFNMGQEKGRQIGELGCLKNLKGRLVIRNLQLVKGKEGGEEANLSEKINLFSLRLEWGRDREGDNYGEEDVLDGLRHHPNLEELAISGFMGDQFP
ncbi:putative disease resistance protein RGA3 [Coffea eugenioides]|uniref:putative disease resistance protein RGA3 n=1 Tax=Coffea eugenioides TaxID=49369 RepID=UPI000F60B996|nr:putative disease resistance protein RGA3 [Coffea eugenioides]